MNILVFNGSPRIHGNTSALLEELIRGAKEAGAKVEQIIAHQVKLKYCTGCLKCNLLKQCAIRNDDWRHLSQQILNADVLVFGSPVYFHHLTSGLKKILDRFRSFLQVQITEDGLQHTPFHSWRKHFILVLSLGSSVADDARPIIDLFQFMIEVLGPDNKLSVVIGTRLAVANQVRMSLDALQALYTKMKLPSEWALVDYQRNQALLEQCYLLGKNIRQND